LDDAIADRLRRLGFSLGDSDEHAFKLVNLLKSLEQNKEKVVDTSDPRFLVVEEADLQAQEYDAIDKFILNHLCGDLVEEVMDASSEQLTDALIASGSKGKTGKKKL
jgi:hypothetical protein